MSEANRIKRAYKEKRRLFFKALPKDPIMLSPEANWVCIEEGIHPVDAERAMLEARKELRAFFPPTLSEGAAKLLTQADIDRFSFVTGPGNVVANAIAFQNITFARSNPRTRGSLRTHNKSLSERAVWCVIEGEDRDRRRGKKRDSDSGTRGSLGESANATVNDQEMRRLIKFWKAGEKLGVK
jgi:hypothetical protein